jgi:hypothetical protein
MKHWLSNQALAFKSSIGFQIKHWLSNEALAFK